MKGKLTKNEYEDFHKIEFDFDNKTVKVNGEELKESIDCVSLYWDGEHGVEFSYKIRDYRVKAEKLTRNM